MNFTKNIKKYFKTLWLFIIFTNEIEYKQKKKRVKERKPGPGEIYYKVKVKTGNCNNASTDANVYLTICGKRGDLPRKHLFNKYNAIRMENGYKFKFERNSNNVFKLIGNDVGQLTNIIVEVI